MAESKYEKSTTAPESGFQDFSKKSMQYAIACVAGMLFLFLVVYAIRSVYIHYATRNSELLPLVNEIQKDIKAINDKKVMTGWEVTDAEVEVNFVVAASTETTADIKAASGTVGTERQNAGRLLLKLHPLGAPASNEAGTEFRSEPIIEKHSLLKKGGSKEKKEH